MTKLEIDVRQLLPEGKHILNGEFDPAMSGETLDIIDPATQETLLAVPRGKQEDIDAAIAAATSAFRGWRDMNPTDRSHLLWKWGELCHHHSEEIAALESMEVGKPLAESRGVTHALANHIHYMAGAADKILGATLPTTKPEILGFTLREPFGVCGSIVPWNVPGILMVRDVAPALAAGNTMVVKPAEDASLTCLYIIKLALEAGIPPGVVNVVTGYGHEAGAALAGHPEVRHMSFTGSPETGTKVMEACAKHHVPLHLELGGKSPQIVLRDADLNQAVPTIVRYLVYNSGQICYAGTRLIVEESVRPRLVSAVSDAFKNLHVGRWYEDGVNMGPLINARQEERVLNYLQVGSEEGARVAVGGHKLTDGEYGRGFFVEPTLFDDVKPDMRIAQEEIFGPVLSVIGFKDIDEALEIANGTPYGLAASIWTDNLQRAMTLTRGIEAGQVYVNTYFMRDVLGAPFGGYKRSGFGRIQGYETILDYTQLKTVIINAEM